MSGDMLIIFALLLPLMTAAGIAAAGSLPALRESVTLAGAALLFVIVLLLTQAVAQGARPQWSSGDSAAGLSFGFQLEPLGALFALVASALWIVNSVYSIGYMRGNRERNQTRFYICFALALFGVMGVALARNLFTLFVFYEVLTLSTYPLVAHKGDAAARRGAATYILTLLGTSIAFFLTAVIWTWFLAGRSLEFTEGGLLTAAGISPVTAGILLVLFVLGISKAATMPFHFWLPSAMVAPTPVSALLHAVAVVKAGVFALLKISTGIFGLSLMAATPVREGLLVLACFTIIVASLIALTKDNLKARLAWSTIAQLAYITAGVLLATDAGMLGGALQLAAHAVGKITLFMCAGAIYVATGYTQVSQLTGLGRKMPLVFIAFLIGALSIIGLPPLIGMWPKFFLMQGAASAGEEWVIGVFIVSTLLSLAYLLPIPLRALMPPPDAPALSDFKRPGGAPALTVIAPVITAMLCLILFFAAGSLITFLSPALAPSMLAPLSEPLP